MHSPPTQSKSAFTIHIPVIFKEHIPGGEKHWGALLSTHLASFSETPFLVQVPSLEPDLGQAELDQFHLPEES